MIKRISIGFVLVIICLTNNWAQENLVPNPGFEDLEDVSNITLPTLPDWFKPYGNTDESIFSGNIRDFSKDWYSLSSRVNLLSVIYLPWRWRCGDILCDTILTNSNLDSAYSALARSGLGSVGFRFGAYGNGGKEYVGSVGVELKQALEEDELYYVEFYANSMSRNGFERIGIHFSDSLHQDYYTFEELLEKERYWSRDNSLVNSRLPVAASVESLPERYYFNEWKRVCATYRAKGGEKYLHIGQFLPAEERYVYSREHGRIPVYDDTTYTVGVGGVIFIDDVVVKKWQPGMFFKDAYEGKVYACDPGFPKVLELTDTFEAYDWGSGYDSLATFAVSEEGYYKVQLDGYGCFLEDSVEVLYRPGYTLPVAPVLQDTMLCASELPYLVSVSPEPEVRLRWSNDDRGESAAYSQPGNHYLEVSNLCGTVISRFKVEVPDAISDYHLPLQQRVFCKTDSINEEVCVNEKFTFVQWENGTSDVCRTLTDTGTYIVHAENKCAILQDTLVLSHYPDLTVIPPNDTLLCTETSSVLVAVQAQNQTGVSWSTGDTATSTYYTTTGEHYVEITHQCESQYHYFSIVLFDSTTYDFTIPSPVLYCLGDTISYTVQAPEIYTTILWQDSIEALVRVLTDTGAYKIIAQNVCMTKEIDFQMAYYPDEFILPELEICLGEIYTPAISPHYSTYRWKGTNFGKELQPDSSGYYELITTTPCGTWNSGTYITIIKPKPLGIGDTVISCDADGNRSLMLEVDPYFSRVYWPNGYIGNRIELEEAGAYWLRAVHVCGEVLDTIHVAACENNYEVFLPNIITPNGDQKNDCLEIGYDYVIPELLEVYNRYGSLVYAQDGGDRWCDEEISEGVYYYHFHYRTPSGTQEYKKSWLQVVR